MIRNLINKLLTYFKSKKYYRIYIEVPINRTFTGKKISTILKFKGWSNIEKLMDSKILSLTKNPRKVIAASTTVISDSLDHAYRDVWMRGYLAGLEDSGIQALVGVEE